MECFNCKKEIMENELYYELIFLESKVICIGCSFDENLEVL